jgi:hypothetical protein
MKSIVSMFNIIFLLYAPSATMAGAAVDNNQIAERLKQFESSINLNIKGLAGETGESHQDRIERFTERARGLKERQRVTLQTGLKLIDERVFGDQEKGMSVVATTAPQVLPKEIENDPMKKRKKTFPLSSNELKPGIPEDTPKRLYCEGVESKIRLCEICREEMDQEREKLLKCRKKECKTAVHRKCVDGWTMRRMGVSHHCSYCASRSIDDVKYRYWCEIE